MNDITEKYADKVTPEYQMAMQMAMQCIVTCRQILEANKKQYEDLINGKQYMDSVGGLLNPSLYRDMLYSKNFEVQLKLAEAAMKFLRETDAIIATIQENVGATT